ncbi:sporulation integral membrane protein YlbJ [Tepidibacter formicigenes]|jgi:sporulation integral membrane protein YlbJ|uniref:Sporulation integral membrane protein YlbJ n=1 Tax=Tepidibacter formicigenes DSM 15518 TaxID=1123349 RepID=A0A1M6KIF4_9FIRM|nr:sporulation integral membrane protein YlbJ [Tepidibacter formicigenes]SHJ58726.1 sporulation integral membrane protein YlbJ [Tepidibacter formicigenes DSM 15518]
MKKNALIKSLLPGIIVLFFICGVVAFPKDAVESARIGMNITLNILVPSLLPFLIGANLLINLKIIDMVGLFLERITRYLFNVPGKGSLVFAMSIISGYPIGSKLTSQLRENKEISNYEAQRLASFCSTSGPLFMVGSVGIGMFNSSKIGYFIALCHYLGALTVGFMFRNYGRKLENNCRFKKNINIIEEIKKIIIFKNSENKGFYTILGDAVRSGINTILVVGGFVIIFSVVFKILSVLKFIDIISNVIFILLYPFNIPEDIIHAFISGLFEITIGCNNISLSYGVPLILKISLCTFVISFSGISILAQCSNFLSKTDINIYLYILSKFLHGILAFIYCYLLYPFFKNTLNITTFYNSIYYKIYTNRIYPEISYYNTIFLIICLIIYVFSYMNITKRKYKI